MVLAFLNLGPSEVLLILLLLLVFFGVDRLPQLARSVGRFRGEMERARVQFERALEDEESRAQREMQTFERQRESQMRAQQEPALAEEANLRQAAETLGIPSAGRSVEELRAAIAQRVGAPVDKAPAGESGAAEKT